MAIAQVANGMGTFGASPVSVASTVSGSNPIGIAGTWGGSGYATGVTWNGVAMTRIQDLNASAGSYYMSMWFIANPTTGNVTVSGTGNFQVAFDQFSGSTATTYDALSTNTNSNSSTISTTTTVVASNCWLITTASIDGNATGGGSQYTNRNVAGNWTMGDSNGTVGTGAQVQTINTASGAGNFNSMISISLAEAPAAGGAYTKGNFFSFM